MVEVVSGADSSLADLMLAAGPVIRRQVEISRDVRIVSYDAATQTATIQPWTNDPELAADGSITGTVLPTVPGVPVRWPWGGGRALTWGLEEGDRAVAVFRTVSHDEVDSGAACPVTPASLRRWSWADVWVEPCGAVPEDPAPARSDGQPALTMPAGEALHVGATGATHTLARADSVQARLARLEAWMTLHTHPVAGALASPITPPAYLGTFTPPTPGPATTVEGIETDRVKVDT